MQTTFKVPGLSWAQVDNCALNVLGNMCPECLEQPQAVPVLRIFEKELRRVYGIGYGIEELQWGTEAQFDPTTNEIILDQSVYDQLCIGNPRAGFTVAHEIGHAILHGRYFKEIHTGNRGAKKFNRGSIPPYMDSEAQANRFGSAFLMPTPMVSMVINQGGGVHDIMDIYNASFTAAQIKYNEILKKLGL